MPGIFSLSETTRFTIPIFNLILPAAFSNPITIGTEATITNVRISLQRDGVSVISPPVAFNVDGTVTGHVGVTGVLNGSIMTVLVTSTYINANGGAGRWTCRCFSTALTGSYPSTDWADVGTNVSVGALDATTAKTAVTAGTIYTNAATAATQATTAATQATTAATQATTAASQATTAATQATTAAANTTSQIPVPDLIPSILTPSLTPSMSDQVALLYLLLSGLPRTFDPATGRIYLDLSPMYVPAGPVPPGKLAFYQCWADPARTIPPTTLAAVVAQDPLTVV